MLRNVTAASFLRLPTTLLNEVLSLNAQEFGQRGLMRLDFSVLNEVLSLNAQESMLPINRGHIEISSMKS